MSEEQVSEGRAARDEAERAMRRLLREHELPEPDEILDHEDGGIVCLWHGPKVAIVVDLEPGRRDPRRRSQLPLIGKG